MRRASLRAIRSRVERLADACGADEEPTIVIHWLHAYDNCPSCGYNLEAHARDQALEKARREDGPDARKRRVVFYWWPSMLGACPRCGATLP